jgi:hypothetical protein
MRTSSHSLPPVPVREGELLGSAFVAARRFPADPALPAPSKKFEGEFPRRSHSLENLPNGAVLHKGYPILGCGTALPAPAVDSWPYIPPGGDLVVAAAAAAVVAAAVAAVAAAAASELDALSSGGVRRSYKDYFPALRSAPVDEIICIQAGRAGTRLPARVHLRWGTAVAAAAAATAAGLFRLPLVGPLPVGLALS